MNTVRSLIRAMASCVLTGTLFLLFVFGYLMYSVLWVIRVMQIKKLFLTLSVLTSVLFFAGMGAYYFLGCLPVRHESVTVVIPKGSTARQIADSLRVRNVITSRKAFIAWMKLTGIERSIQAGKYTFFTSSGALAAVRSLSNAAPIEKLVKIPEGLTIEQTAARIAWFLPVDTAEFARLCYDTAFIATISGINAKNLEGYLFPDSYRFLETAGPAEIIRRLASRFVKEYARLDTVSGAVRHLQRGEIVTLASIIEKEAALPEERAHIAGVFHNRLKRGEPLGADPTVRFVFKKFDGPLRLSELNTGSPYNTRKFKGLPPGPICSPGLASLRAAVAPDITDDLFFVAKWDGSGAHDFSVTYEEHNRKKKTARKLNELRIRTKEHPCTTAP